MAAGDRAYWSDIADESAWTSGTPTWAQSGGSVLSINNGTLTMRYKRAGAGASKTIHLRLELVRGSTSNSGSNTYAFTLPAGWPTFRTFRSTGTGAVYLATGATYPCLAYGITGDTFVLAYTKTEARVGNQAGGSGHPTGGAWATGDAIVADLTYEAA